MPRRSPRVIGLVLLALVVTVLAACSSAGPAVTKMDAASAVNELRTRTIIDVRTADEFAAGHIAGAQNIDVETADFAQRFASLDKNAKYLVYCHSGRRSAIAADTMAKAGFTDIVDGGGMQSLVDAGAPTE